MRVKKSFDILFPLPKSQKCRLLNLVNDFLDYQKLPLVAKRELRQDREKGKGEDPGVNRSVSASLAWLCRAQDNSSTHDGGVARHFGLIGGWGPSYPETTGYIIPTFLAYADLHQDGALVARARHMLDWLVGIQFSEGGFPGGTINENPVVPVTFNTAQILLGLAEGASRFGEPYLQSMHRAAEWLVKTQDKDGCWRKYPSPFANPGEKVYETHSALGLIRATQVGKEDKYAKAALRNVRWALTKQQRNGWFADCCLEDTSQPLTHTIGYALRGILELYRFSGDEALLKAGLLTGENMLDALESNGFLPGRLDNSWRGSVTWSCLTGNAQMAYCWMMLYEDTRDIRFRDAAFIANEFVRRTVRLDGSSDTAGAIKGSFPVSGDYGTYEYLSWAAKFFVDSNLYEQKIRHEKK